MSEGFIGEVRALPFGFAPQGWAPCNGQELQTRDNTALFALLGFTYGGNGTTTFALPKLAPLEGKEGAIAYYIALRGAFPPRA